MNAKLSPAVSVVILAAVIVTIFSIMWVAANQKGPRLPSSMGEAMKASGNSPNRIPASATASSGQPLPGNAPAQKGK